MTNGAPALEKKGRLLVRSYHDEAPMADSVDTALAWRLISFAKPHSVPLAISLLLMPITTGASLIQPFLIGRAVNAAIVLRSVDALLDVILYFFVAILVEFLARFGQTWLMQLAGQNTMADIRRAVFAHIQGLRVSYFDRTPIGRVVTRVTNDVDAIGELFASGAVTAIADFLTLIGIVAFMLYLDWKLALFALAALPPLIVVVEIFRRYARQAFRAIRAKTAQLNAYLAEQVQGIAIVQAFGRESSCGEEYAGINSEYRDANRTSIKYDALLYSVVEAVAAACVAIVLWYAGSRAGVLTNPAAAAAYVGTVVSFYEYIQRFFVPIRDLSSKYTIIQSSLASAERIFALLDVLEPDAPRRDDVSKDSDSDPDIVLAFRDVSFAYGRGDQVLHGVDFSVRRGERVAIVGATGAGKTTAVSLFLRLYEVDQGRVLVDGRDVRSLDRHDLRRRFAVVQQDVFLFSGTVLENVALGDDTPDEARVEAALRRVGAWDLVSRRPGGLRAEVAERGANFSAGERQLLAFARALYGDPPHLILDEATANVDSETEARLQAAVAEVLENRTSLIIAHRLSTIRRCDRILVFHRGEIVESGSHEELLAQSGVYARLHALQFAEEGPAELVAAPA